MENIKFNKVSCLIIIAFLISTCAGNKSAVTAHFPDAMLPHVKEQYKVQWEKGKILYELNCAKCHTIKEKKRVIIPDFREEQLKGYELRITNAKHEASLPDTLVTEEELGLIMTFLRYKKPNETAKK